VPKYDVPEDPIVAMHAPDTDSLTWEELCTRFRGKWVLACITEMGEYRDPVRALVLAVGSREQMTVATKKAIAAGVPPGRVLQNLQPTAYGLLPRREVEPSEPQGPGWRK